MKIFIDRTSTTPVYLQIRNAIRDMIVEGSLPKGAGLPPERKLAQKLGVNRSTVLNAYRELKADGLVDSHIGRGTIVAGSDTGEDTYVFQSAAPMHWKQAFNQAAGRFQEPLTRDLLELTNSEDVISFAAGVAAPGLEPVNYLNLIRYEIEEKNINMLQHTPTEGCYELRRNLCRLMADRGIEASTDNVMVLSGSQQGIDIAARVLIDPGDVVITEEPSFFCAIQIFKAAGARVIGVPADDRGMRVDLLESLLTRVNPKFIYTMPTFQNPSGAVMAMDRRHKLIELAYRYNVPILEDDAYVELRYEGDRLPALKSLDRPGYVIYLSTFSKIAFQGLRIGWVCAVPQVINQFTMVKQMADLHSASLSQWVVNGFLDRGMLGGHLETICREYKSRRDIMLDALDRYAVKGMVWNKPDGGLYIWCRLPDGVSQSKLLSKAASYRVAFVPGDVFSSAGMLQNYIRLNFTFSDPERIHAGVKRLMLAVKESLNESKRIDENSRYEIRPII